MCCGLIEKVLLAGIEAAPIINVALVQLFARNQLRREELELAFFVFDVHLPERFPGGLLAEKS